MIIGHNILKTCFLLFLGIFTFYFSHVYGSEIQYLFPIPDTEHHQPETVIILRFWNINPDQIANLNSFITLTGDISGNLTGQTVVSTDGRTINFKPDVNYSLGEKVNVRVTPRRIGQSNAFLDTTFHFTILEELPPSFPEPDPLFSSQGNESQSIRKTTVTNGPDPVILNGVSIPPDFPIINVLTSDNPDTGYVFVSKLEDNTFHIISDNEGNPVWYRRVTAGNSFDLKVQHDGQLSMTSPYEITRYLHIAMDSTYTVTDTFRTALGYWIDIHELQVMPNGDYYLINGEHRNVDMSKVVEGGDPNAYVVDNFIVGMDSEDHLIFLWRSMDHYEVTNAIHKDLTQNRIDYAHLNAIEIDHDGHILTSCRHQDEITKIDRNTGQIIWRLGGRYDEFQWINDVARISYQHDIRVLPNGHYTIFDNGNFHNPPFSRALELEVDTNNWTVTKVWEYNSGDIQSEGMGNAQRLPGGNTLINWGYIPYPFLTEVRPDGSKALEMTFRDGGRSYRTFKFPWEGKAAIPYMILVHNTDRITLLFNKFGDPDVSYYNIYAGTSPHPTQIVATTTQPFKHLITELENNQHYYFRVTAVNTIGEESDYSNEQNMLVNLTVPGENLIQNGDFESGFSSWNLNVYNGAETSVEITPDGEMHFVILNPGLNLSDIVLNQTDIPVLQGRTYQIGFDAYAEGSRLFEVSLQKDDPPWNNISLNGPSWITPQKQHFTYEFVLDDPSATEALISLKAGGSPINVYVDNVSLKQILDLSPPEANFKADTTMGMHPFEVHFQDLSFGSITSWSWDFGDGGTSTDQHPSHIYQSADTFSISLTVTGPEGSDVMIRDNYITVLESPPVADFSADTTSGFWPFTVQFSDLSTGVISTWNWSFGDGEISIEQSPSHAYQTADTFDVTLSVTGPGGADTLLRENHILVS
ncbi:aryl-sulfate sulfotransferase, partial [candidate division KSB1 bacterium]|nr:aryl-sulfate sulfotransferase [candidate division KSB1 bacterium]